MKAFAAALVGLALVVAPAMAAETVVNVSLEDNAIKPAESILRPGPVSFVVHNDSLSETHEMVIVKGDEAKSPLPFDAKKNRIAESKVEALGEVADLAPGASKTLKVVLAKGAYTLLCNVKGHYHDGMHTVITVN
jgi:uncharacterized cupredoxin-like copper-binding protein